MIKLVLASEQFWDGHILLMQLPGGFSQKGANHLPNFRGFRCHSCFLLGVYLDVPLEVRING